MKKNNYAHKYVFFKKMQIIFLVLNSLLLGITFSAFLSPFLSNKNFSSFNYLQGIIFLILAFVVALLYSSLPLLVNAKCPRCGKNVAQKPFPTFPGNELKHCLGCERSFLNTIKKIDCYFKKNHYFIYMIRNVIAQFSILVVFFLLGFLFYYIIMI